MALPQQIQDAFKALTIDETNSGLHDGLTSLPASGSQQLESYSPVDGQLIGRITVPTDDETNATLERAQEAFKEWRTWPAPKRGEIVRQLGEAFRAHKAHLGAIESYEMGKIYQEGLGEVQEVIDICDFAVGLSRQLYGKTTFSERPGHRMYEQWHPLGIVGIISAFNFPTAVWGWNAMVAAACGDVMVWKPSEKTPISALACHRIIEEVLRANNVPAGVFNLIAGDRHTGELMVRDPRVALVSATGSVPMGRTVGTEVAQRLGRSLLELGGNNAVILTPSANLELAVPALVFAAAGTTGQRCTTARRLIVHADIYDKVKEQLTSAYQQLPDKVGSPLDPSTLIGPLIDTASVETMQESLKLVEAEGGKVLAGGQPLTVKGYENGHYVAPAIVEADQQYGTVCHETFAPILYLMKYTTLEEAVALQNGVPQGLSSAIFTENMKEMEHFLSVLGSDCGIANVNIGPSGAEIGLAFGGEKETGGGRESGSDAWKAYMRRQSVTINYSDDLPLAQGIEFNL